MTTKTDTDTLPPNNEHKVRLRAWIFGALSALFLCALTPFNNAFKNGTPLAGGHFPLAPFILFFIFTFVAALIKKRQKNETPLLTGKELFVIWMLMALVSGIAYTGLVRTFFINLTAPFHFATPENRWDQTLLPYIPDGWYPQDADAIRLIYNGLDGGRNMGWLEILWRIPWAGWIQPLCLWAFFILLCYFVMGCFINLISRQWLVNERMNFPLLQVPDLVQQYYDSNSFFQLFSNKFLMVGILLPVCLHTLNGLHFYFPSFPQLQTLVLAGPYFPRQGLFEGFQKLKIYIYPAFIGFAFLTSRQISLSCWIWFILGAFIMGLLGVLGYNVPRHSLGTIFGPTITYPEETQMIGAYMVFFLFLLWLGRKHLASLVRHAFWLGGSGEADRQWMGSRFAFWGFVLGFSAIVFWMRYFGMALLPAFLTILAFFVALIVAARLVCQGGVAYYTLSSAPIDAVLIFCGHQIFSKVGILAAAVVQKMLFVDLREGLMPSLLHGSKVTRKISGQRMVFLFLYSIIALAVVVSFVSMLALAYKYGFRELNLEWATRTTLAVYDTAKTAMENPVDPGPWVLGFTLFGAFVMVVLSFCYHRFYWWPIHPIGYLLAYTSAMRILWFSFFVGWFINSLCMRYGGMDLFRKLRLFFIGMIIGDFLMGGFWAGIGFFSHSSYLVLPD